MSARRWVVAGGGTGGHVTPALALGEEIVARGDRVLFLGSERGLDGLLVPAAGFELRTLPARQVKGKGLVGGARALLDLPRVTLAARRLLAEFGAEIVVSVGGYASVPAVLAARLRGTPVALVNTDAVPGLANRACGRLARRIFVGFEAAAPAFGGGRLAERVRVVGVPVRRNLVSAFAGAPPRRVPAPPLRLLVFGGSQGAHQLNQALMALAPRLAGRVEVFHQTGEADCERVAEAWARAGVRAEVAAFEPEMPARYRWADLAICRSGALTVAELALAGLPALLIPYPFAANDEQSANARELVRLGAAERLDPHGLTPETLGAALERLLDSPELLRAMGERAAKLARPDAAARIVEECRALLD